MTVSKRHYLLPRSTDPLADLPGAGTRRSGLGWRVLLLGSVAGAALLTQPARAQTAPVTFFGEDTNGSGTLSSTPNSNQARADLFSHLQGVGTETFESIVVGTTNPTITFPGAGTAVLNGSGQVQSGATSSDQYPISGNNFYNAGTSSFSITFGSPVAAFGFYGTDIGDVNGQLTLTLNQAGGGSTLLTVPNVVDASADGSALYFGFYNTGIQYTSIVFGNTGSGDVFGFDDFSVGAVTQIVTTPRVINTTDGDLAANVFSLASPAATAGTVQFDGGTLRLTGGAFPGNIVPSPVTIDANNGTVDTSTGNGGFSGVVSGPGSLTITGGGTFSLTGANTYAGGTVVNGSTVAVGSSTALGTGLLSLNGGTLRAGVDGLTVGNATTLGSSGGTLDTQGFGLTATGVIGGAGQLTKVGTGTLALTAANTYRGGTSLNAGAVALGNGAALGTGTVTFRGGALQAGANGLVVGNAAVLASDATIDTQGFGLTYAGVVSGSGALAKAGMGTLALTGANTYAGGTVVGAGAVAVGNNAALGTGLLSFAGGALQAAANGLTIGNAATIARPGGAIDTQAFGLTYAGSIAGAGQLIKNGSGTLALTAANSYAGGTALDAGTIAVGNSAALGTGTLAFNGGVLQALTDGLTLGNAATLAGNATIDTQGFGLAYAGTLSGAGRLTKAGSGTLALTAANANTGGVALTAGRIAITNGAALGSGTLTVGNAALQAAVGGLTLTNAATLAGNGTIDTQGFGLTYAGTIAGTGTLTKIGAGTLALPGANTYAGGTTLAAGTVAVGTGASLGTGVVTFNGGALQATADGLAVGNAATLAGNGTIDTQGFGLTYAGAITGTGALIKLGAGRLTLAADDSATGGTTIAAGVLQVGAGGTTGSLAGPVFDNGTLAFDRSDDVTFTGAIAGSGAVRKAGAGTLTLTRASSYGGGTALLAGTLAVGDSAALGTGPLAMDEGTTLRFTTSGLTLANAIVFTGVSDPTIDTGSGDETISGPISGSGALTKLGSGTLDLTAANPYTGATTVAAGTLLVDGSIAGSAVTVADGAALGGSGTIGSLVALDGATVVPRLGRTLAVVGNVTFASGSTYQVTVNGDGSTSSLAIGGRATLNGATLSVLAGTTAFSIARTYTLLTAPGGVSGVFGTIDAGALALLTPSVSYTADSVLLSLHPQRFALVGSTPNQTAAAGAIQALGPSDPLFNSVVTQDTAGARQAFNATSGVAHASSTTVVESTTFLLTSIVLDRLWDVGGSGLSARQVLDQFSPDRLPALVRCYGPVPDPVPVAPASYTVWGEGFGSFGHSDGGANAGTLDRSLGGFVAGIDTPLTGPLDKWRVGVAGGYTNTNFTSHIDGGEGTVQSVFGSLYGGARYGAVDVRLGTTVSGTFTDTVRRVAFPGFLESEKSSNDGIVVQGFGEVGYRFPFPRAVLEPVVGAAFLHVHQDGFTENGGAAALIGAPTDTDIGTTTVGVRGEVAPVSGVPLVAHAFLGWQHTIGPISPTAVLALAANPANSFTVSGSPIDRDALAASAALDYRSSAALDIGVTYTGLVGNEATDHSVKGRMEYRF